MVPLSVVYEPGCGHEDMYLATSASIVQMAACSSVSDLLIR